MHEPPTVLAEQQHRTENAVELRFDEARKRVENRLERRAHRDHLEDLRLAVAQRVGEPAVGDVARDAGHSEHVAARVAHRHLGREDPGLAARAVVDIFLEVDHRPAGADDLLLVVEEPLRDLGRQQLQVGLADQVGGNGSAHSRRRDAVADDEAAFDVLDPEVVVQAIDQRLQRQPFVESGALVAQLGDVLVGRQPTAAGKRLPPDRDRPAVRQLVAPFARLFAGPHRRAMHEIVFDLERQRPRRDAQVDDLAPGDAGLQLLDVEPIELGVAVVADRQPRVAVEHAHAERQRLDRGVVETGFVGEALDLGMPFARSVRVRIGGGAQQIREGGAAGGRFEGGVVGGRLSVAAQSLRAHGSILRRIRRPSPRRVARLLKSAEDRRGQLMEREKTRRGRDGPIVCNACEEGGGTW